MKYIFKKICDNFKRKILLNTDIPEITPISIRKGKNSHKRINLLIPSINKEHAFGGIYTAIDFFKTISQHIGKEYIKRIIITDATPNNDALDEYKDYFLIDCEEESEQEFQIVSVADRYGKTLPINENDIFLATAWWTAYNAQKIVQEQAKSYDKQIKPILYLIQDFEPGFYPWSSRYVLAESTYKYKKPQIAIFNSSYLKKFFDIEKFKFYKEFTFEPILNKSLNEHLTQISKFDKEKQILIYGRPSTPRNAFELIIQALKQTVYEIKDIKDWKIISAGESHPDIDLGNNIILKSVGKVNINEYSDLLKQSFLGISLMISPHPSYPPLEMEYYKVKTITNTFKGKKLIPQPYLYPLDRLSIEDLAFKITKICKTYYTDSKVQNNFLENKIKTDKYPFIHELIKIIKDI